MKIKPQYRDGLWNAFVLALVCGCFACFVACVTHFAEQSETETEFKRLQQEIAESDYDRSPTIENQYVKLSRGIEGRAYAETMARDHGGNIIDDLDAFFAANPTCCVCGQPAEEAHQKAHEAHDGRSGTANEHDISNLLPFCKRCHLLIGHLGHFGNSNPDVETHVKILHDAKAKADAERIARAGR